MRQSRLASLIETTISTAIGFLLTLAVAPIVYPMFGHAFTMKQNVGLCIVFTVLSIARGYAVRRWAEGRIKAASARIAAMAKE